MSNDLQDEKTDKKLELLKTLTDTMSTYRAESATVAARRRRVMYDLNRKSGITYLDLAAACDLNPARIAHEMAKEIAERNLSEKKKS
jgi:hypothetical protein